MGFKDVTEYEMDKVLALVDADNSGEVCFEEFLMTCISPSEMLTKENLEKAFSDFDTSGDRSVSPTEIMKALEPKNGHVSTAVWELVFNVKPGELSQKKTEITFNEFKLFMERIFSMESI